MKQNLSADYKQIVFLYWMLITTVFWVQSFNVVPFWEATFLALSVSIVVIPMNHFLSDYLLTKAMREKRMTLFCVQFMLMILFVSFVVALVFYGFGHLERTGTFVHSGQPINADSLASDFGMLIPSMIVVSLGFCGLRFYHEHACLEKINRELQFKTLQEQITPHFMFNVLNHIHVLMQEDVELASFMLVKYSDILRYQLYQGQKEVVCLAQEVQFLKSYIEVEKIRWADKLTVTCSWQTSNEAIEVHPLLLITFVENAFKHVSRSSSTKGDVTVTFRQSHEEISLTVVNSKSYLMPRSEVPGLGLENVRKRLDILYPRKHVLTCQETDSAYCVELIVTLV